MLVDPYEKLMLSVPAVNVNILYPPEVVEV